MCWGSTFDNSFITTPVAIPDLSTVTAISAGGLSACALLTGGTIACWGENFAGQLGNGTTTASMTPVTVSNLTGAIAVAAGELHTCALLSNGTIQCWGINYDGELGNGTTTESSTPVLVSGL
jgi:alpha-tubulin suppressor-like RCC1 family protein